MRLVFCRILVCFTWYTAFVCSCGFSTISYYFLDTFCVSLFPPQATSVHTDKKDDRTSVCVSFSQSRWLLFSTNQVTRRLFQPNIIAKGDNVSSRPSPRAFKCYMARKLSTQNSGGYMMRSATLEAKYYKSGYQYCSQGSCTLSQAPKRWKTMFVVLIDNIIFSVYQCEPNFFEPTSFKAREIHCKTRTGKPRYVVVYEVVVYLPWPLASFNNHIDVQSNCHSLIYVQMAASV